MLCLFYLFIIIINISPLLCFYLCVFILSILLLSLFSSLAMALVNGVNGGAGGLVLSFGEMLIDFVPAVTLLGPPSLLQKG